MVELINKIMIVGIISAVIIIGMMSSTINTSLFDDSLTWAALIISISAGVIITLIVDKKSSDSHNEVVGAQNEISNLLARLDETDQKHDEALSKLNQSRIKNEELAKNSVLSSLCYIESMFDKLISALKNNPLTGKDMKLIVNVLDHLESPLNIIEQAIPQSSIEFKRHGTEIQDITMLIRRLIIASVAVSDEEAKRTFTLIEKTHPKLKALIHKIS